MSVLIIRAHSRFAVCRKAWLDAAGPSATRATAAEALLIELSLEGARVSTADEGIALGDTLHLSITGADPIAARVRWRGDGTIGLRFVPPLHTAALDALVRLCRGEGEANHALRA